MGVSLHWGSIGEPGGGLVTRDFEIWTKEGSGHRASLSVYWSSTRGTWRNGSFIGDPEGYVKEGSGNGHLSPLGPHWGIWRRGSFSGDFETVKVRSVNKVSLSLSLWKLCEGNLEGELLYWGL